MPLLEASPDHEAFVYCITNLIDGREYIGKKVFWTLRKGKGTRRVRRESDWRKYYGSCEELKADIKALGQENFAREILRLCKTRGESGFFEVKEQFTRGVLTSDGFYNRAINKWQTFYPTPQKTVFLQRATLFITTTSHQL
jgi:hypothetical protein